MIFSSSSFLILLIILYQNPADTKPAPTAKPTVSATQPLPIAPKPETPPRTDLLPQKVEEHRVPGLLLPADTMHLLEARIHTLEALFQAERENLDRALKLQAEMAKVELESFKEAQNLRSQQDSRVLELTRNAEDGAYKMMQSRDQSTSSVFTFFQVAIGFFTILVIVSVPIAGFFAAKINKKYENMFVEFKEFRRKFPRGRSVSHGARPLVYHLEMTQRALNLEDRNGGAAPWTTSLASAA